MRLFVAIPLEPTMTHLLEDVQTKYLSQAGIRLEDADKLHMTLLYIGEVEAATPYIAALKNINFKPFPLTLEQGGTFVKRQTVYYVAIKAHNELAKLADDILTAVNQVHPLEYHFNPHITLARSNREHPYITDKLQGTMLVDKFVLFESKAAKYWPISIYNVSK